MLTLHDDIELTLGDEWEILGSLQQEDGSALNLSPDVGIAWVLLDPDGVAVPNLVDFATLERPDPVSSGNVMITIDAALTKTFRPGRYTDALRVTVGSAPSMLWRGLILAGADPFYTTEVTVAPPTIEDAPNDDKFYVRQDGAWVEMPAAVAPPPPDDAPSDGKFYVRQDGAWVELPSGFSVTFEYTFAKQTTAPPTNSQLRFDNLDPTLVTRIWLNNNDANSTDDSNLIGMIQAGYIIFVQDKDDPTKYARYSATGPATNLGSYCEVPVAYISGLDVLNDNQRVIVLVYGGG